MNSLAVTAEQVEQARVLADRARQGDRRAVARCITLIENQHPLSYEVVKHLYPHTGNAYRVGVTGPPGVGKSSLISSLITTCREEDRSIGVISVDPSSPFTQGALLGDRIRLADHFLDPEVFIRSMATRGHLGGVAETTLQASLVLDAAGKDVIFLETVGVGQSEVEITTVADTIILSLMPGSGDSIQALKAGVMEIPDIIVVNKMDHPAADNMLNEVKSILSLAQNSGGWMPPVLATEAVRGEGICELWEQVGEHAAYLRDHDLLETRRQESLKREVLSLAARRLEHRMVDRASSDPHLADLLGRVQSRDLDPLSAVRLVLRDVFDVPEEDLR